MDEVRNVLLNDDPNVAGDPAEVLGATQQQRAAASTAALEDLHVVRPTLQFMATVSMHKLPPNSNVTASLVVIDNADGGVRAIANGRTFAQSQFDPATEGLGRQAVRRSRCSRSRPRSRTATRRTTPSPPRRSPGASTTAADRAASTT